MGTVKFVISVVTMPFKAPEVSKCPKVCFKCSMCNKFLDSTTCAEHDRKLFCKTCYGRKYSPKGVGFGGGAGALSMDTGEQFGNTESVSNKPIDPNFVFF